MAEENAKPSAPPPYGLIYGRSDIPPMEPPPEAPPAPPVSPTAPPPVAEPVYEVEGELTRSLPLGPDPAIMTCPVCHANVQTITKQKAGLLTWLSCTIMFVLGLVLCCCIPFCMDSCLDVHHICPNCNSVIGKYRRL